MSQSVLESDIMSLFDGQTVQWGDYDMWKEKKNRLLMSYGFLQMQTGSRVYKMIFGIFLLFCGCSMYLLLRSESLNIYYWSREVGISGFIDFMRCIVSGWDVPNFVKYNLPDGLYCAAYILMIDSIWGRRKDMSKHLMVSIIPLAALACEVLQFLGITKGTFDVCDLICYVIPVIIYILFETNCLTNIIREV